MTSELPADADGRRGVVLSISKELEPGTRAMLLLAEGLFRFDIVVAGDTLRTVVRNLADAELKMCGPASSTGAGITFGDAAEYEPGQARVEFALGQGDERVAVNVTIGTLRCADRGTVRVSAQAIVRHSPAG